MKEQDKIIEGVLKVLDWYSRLPVDFKDIETLIKAKRKLVGYSFTFSPIVAQCLESHKNTYSMRKFLIAEEQLKYIESGDSVAKSGLKAEVNKKDSRIQEAKNEALYQKFKGFQMAISGAISSMQQDISILRKELEDASIHNNG